MPEKRKLTYETLERQEGIRGHVLFVVSILLGFSILFSGLTGRLPAVNSWELILQVFGSQPVSYWVWCGLYVSAGVMGEYSILRPEECNRRFETLGSAIIGMCSFVILVFLILAWVDTKTVPIWAVLFLYLCCTATIRAISHLRRFA